MKSLLSGQRKVGKESSGYDFETTPPGSENSGKERVETSSIQRHNSDNFFGGGPHPPPAR